MVYRNVLYDSTKDTYIWEKSGSSVMLLTNQLAGFFDHQYVGKESIDILVFLHVVSYQWKIASETTTFSWVWPVVSLIQSNVGFFDHYYL